MRLTKAMFGRMQTTSFRLTGRLTGLTGLATSAALATALSFAAGCAHQAAEANSPTYGDVLAEDEDLGDPRDSVPPPVEPTIEEVLADENTEELTYDGLEPNDGPTSMVQSAPKRPQMPSMLPSVITGPSGAAPVD